MATDKARPLEGRSVVVTRAPEQSRELIARLEELGAEVLLLPAVSFADPEDCTELDRALQKLETFDWVLLTSQNAGRFFLKRLRVILGEVPFAQAHPQYAAVGPGTARLADQEGIKIDFVASVALGETMAKELGPKLREKRVLLPRSDRARPELPAALRAAGAHVVDVVAYRTVAPNLAASGLLDRIRAGRVDVVTFASPSAFRHLVEELGGDVLHRVAANTAFASIGPVTAAAIRLAGCRVAIEASQSSSAGLAAAVAAHFSKKSPAGARTP